MPPTTSILGIKGFDIENIYECDLMVYTVHYLFSKICCHCQGTNLRLLRIRFIARSDTKALD